MKVVSRLEWGAKAPNCQTMLPLSRVDTIVYHYTASDADEQALHANCATRVRGIQTFHQNTRGWCDIAYNYVVCKHGFVFIGRGPGVKSAATGDDNDHTIAVCFLGDDTANRDDVTAVGRRALGEIARDIQQRAGKKMIYKGHRDFMATSCPGDEIYKYVHSKVFSDFVNFTPDPSKRLDTLRKWILARHAEGWTWQRIKQTANWREFKNLGGR